MSLRDLIRGLQTMNAPLPEPERERAYAPHCDPSILHAPGACKYCDHYPDWQQMRVTQRIGFTDQHSDTTSPCPSTWFRSAEVRNRWGGNRAAR